MIHKVFTGIGTVLLISTLTTGIFTIGYDHSSNLLIFSFVSGIITLFIGKYLEYIHMVQKENGRI